MTDVHLGLPFDEGQYPPPRQWENMAGRQKCPFRLVPLPKPAHKVIRTCPDNRGVLLPPLVRAVAGQSRDFRHWGSFEEPYLPPRVPDRSAFLVRF